MYYISEKEETHIGTLFDLFFNEPDPVWNWGLVSQQYKHH